MRVKGVLHVRGRSPRSKLDSAELSLAAVHFPTGRVVDLPLSVSRRGDDAFKFSSAFGLTDLFEDNDQLDGVRLRFRLVWENSTWNTFVARPGQRGPGVEVTYVDDEVLELSVR
jgi:hypothetical protein